MPCDNHIGEGKKALEHVVGKDRARQIAEKQIGFLLIDIEAIPPSCTLLSASVAASVSIRPPRLVLISKAPRLVLASVSLLIM